MKQTLAQQEFRNRLDVSRRINQIKAELRKYTSTRIKELYNLLDEFVRLKHSEKNRYTWRSLEHEHDLGLSGSQIRYIYSYKFILPPIHKMIDAGKVSESQVCHLIHRFGFLKEEQWQVRMIHAFRAGKIKMSYASELNEQQTKDVLLGRGQPTVADKRLISFTKTVRSFSSVLNSMKIKDNVQTKRLINVLGDLIKKLEDSK
jgi:hypothetical protein